jgi:uracil phosphoribosyltransferase
MANGEWSALTLLAIRYSLFAIRHSPVGTRQGTHMQGVTVVDHPLVQHKLTLMRDKSRTTKGFRQLLNEIGMLLAYEVTRDLPLEMVDIETPLTGMRAPQIAGKKLVFAPILRAGVGFLDGMLNLVPSARVAHIGLYREPDTLQAVEYYFKAPSDLADRTVLVLDPMLATANSAVAAIDRLKERGAKDIRFVCLLAAPEGIEKMRGTHPDVPIWTAAIDSHLNDHGYIIPGLGDAGDRMYGTR